MNFCIGECPTADQLLVLLREAYVPAELSEAILDADKRLLAALLRYCKSNSTLITGLQSRLFAAKKEKDSIAGRCQTLQFRTEALSRQHELDVERYKTQAANDQDIIDQQAELIEVQDNTASKLKRSKKRVKSLWKKKLREQESETCAAEFTVDWLTEECHRLKSAEANAQLRIAEYIEHIQERDSQIAELESRLKKLATNNSNLSTRVKLLEDTNRERESLKSRVSNLQEKFKSEKSKSDSLEQRLKYQSDQADCYRSKCESLGRENADKTKQLDRAKATMESQEKQIKSLTEEKARNEDLNKQIKSLKGSERSLKSEVTKLQTDRSQHLRKITQMEGELKATEKRAEDAEKKEKNDAAQILRHDLVAAKQIKSLTEEKARNEALKKEIAAKAEQVKSLEGSERNLKSEVAKLQTDRSKYLRRITQMEGELKATEKRAEDAEREKKRKNDAARILIHDLKAERQRKPSLSSTPQHKPSTSAAVSVATETDVKMEALDELEDIMNKIVSGHEDKEKEREQLQSEIHKLKEELEKAKNISWGTFWTEKEQDHPDASALQVELDHLKKELQICEEQIEQLKHEKETEKKIWESRLAKEQRKCSVEQRHAKWLRQTLEERRKKWRKQSVHLQEANFKLRRRVNGGVRSVVARKQMKERREMVENMIDENFHSTKNLKLDKALTEIRRQYIPDLH